MQGCLSHSVRQNLLGLPALLFGAPGANPRQINIALPTPSQVIEPECTNQLCFSEAGRRLILYCGSNPFLVFAYAEKGGRYSDVAFLVPYSLLPSDMCGRDSLLPSSKTPRFEVWHPHGVVQGCNCGVIAKVIKHMPM